MLKLIQQNRPGFALKCPNTDSRGEACSMYLSLNKVNLEMPLHSSGQPAQLIKLFPSQNENLPPCQT